MTPSDTHWRRRSPAGSGQALQPHACLDTLARTGGDEFTIVSEIATAEGAQSLASAMESALVQPLSVEGKLMRTGVSAGYALYPDDGADPTELCAAADKAMYVPNAAPTRHDRQGAGQPGGLSVVTTHRNPWR